MIRPSAGEARRPLARPNQPPLNSASTPLCSPTTVVSGMNSSNVIGHASDSPSGASGRARPHRIVTCPLLGPGPIETMRIDGAVAGKAMKDASVGARDPSADPPARIERVPDLLTRNSGGYSAVLGVAEFADT